MTYHDLIGARFEYNGRGPDVFDCYGLVAEMYRRSGRVVPDYVSPDKGDLITNLFHEAVKLWTPVEERPGVMVALRVPGNVHVGYMLPLGKMIHAWEATGGVTVEPIKPWRRRILGFYDHV